MSTSSNRLIKSLSEINQDNLPSFSSLDDNISSNTVSSGSSFIDFFTSITWQTWLIVILILAFLGINVFSYLASGTKETVSIFANIFASNSGVIGKAVVTLAISIPLSSSCNALYCRATSCNNSNLLFTKSN